MGWLRPGRASAQAAGARTALEMLLREEHSTYSWLLEPMLARAGFEIREAGYSGNRIYAAYTCVKG